MTTCQGGSLKLTHFSLFSRPATFVAILRCRGVRFLPSLTAVVAALCPAGFCQSIPTGFRQADKLSVITEAAKERPVKLRGVVTFFDPVRGYAFLQDATAGLFFFPGAPEHPKSLTPEVGDLLEIKSITLRGGFASTVEEDGKGGTPVRATMLGRAQVPEAMAMPWTALNDDSFHNRFMEMCGVVRAVEAGR